MALGLRGPFVVGVLPRALRRDGKNGELRAVVVPRLTLLPRRTAALWEGPVPFGRNRESRRREAAGRRNYPEAVPNGKRENRDNEPKLVLSACRDNRRHSEGVRPAIVITGGRSGAEDVNVVCAGVFPKFWPKKGTPPRNESIERNQRSRRRESFNVLLASCYGA